MQHRLDELQHKLGADHPAFRELGGIFAAATNLPERVALSTEMAGERRMQREALKERLWNLYQDSPEVREFLDENVRIFNGRKREPASFVFLTVCWPSRLTCFRTGSPPMTKSTTDGFLPSQISWESASKIPLVFEATHAVVLRLIERGLVTGLRIDHVDGLRDPHGYLRRLQERVAGGSSSGRHPPFFVLVEKILADGELLPREWPICGATGYASLNALNGLFLDPEGCKKLHQIYESFIGAQVSVRGPGV